MLDADIRDFFTSLDQGWLERFLGHRIADKRVLRLIGKWLGAGVIENGTWSKTPEGSPQGASVSPLLANVYLHYVLDLWAGWWRRRHARGDMIIVRFADDFIAGFEHRGDARQFLRDLRDRFARFALELHPGKTRLIEFGRFAAVRRAARGAGKPGGTFPGQADHDLEADAGKAERGQRPAQAAPARARPGARAVAGQRGTRPHGLLRGARQHPGRPGLPDTGDPALARGSAKPEPARLPELEPDEPPRDAVAPATPHPAPLPGRTLPRSHPRQEPSALAAHAGICAGGRPQGRSLPR